LSRAVQRSARAKRASSVSGPRIAYVRRLAASSCRRLSRAGRRSACAKRASGVSRPRTAYERSDAAPLCRTSSRAVRLSARATRVGSLCRPRASCGRGAQSTRGGGPAASAGLKTLTGAAARRPVSVLPDRCTEVRACEEGQQRRPAWPRLRALRHGANLLAIVTCGAVVSADGEVPTVQQVWHSGERCSALSSCLRSWSAARPATCAKGAAAPADLASLTSDGSSCARGSAGVLYGAAAGVRDERRSTVPSGRIRSSAARSLAWASGASGARWFRHGVASVHRAGRDCIQCRRRRARRAPAAPAGLSSSAGEAGSGHRSGPICAAEPCPRVGGAVLSGRAQHRQH